MEKFRRNTLLIFAIFLAVAPVGFIEAQETVRKPNVIFILADDLGFMDVAFNGSKFYETPNLDKFAKQGMVFRNAYDASPLCSPTRASILTGLHPARIGITFPDCHLPEEVLTKGLDTTRNTSSKWIGAKSVTRLETKYFTMAEALKTAGYVTGHFGKWHLGKVPFDPYNQGFGTDFPHWPWVPAPANYMAPWKWGVNKTEDKGKPGENIEDRTTDEAIKFIKENKDRQFFLNYWAWSVHGPHEANKDLVQKYNLKIDTHNAQQNPVYGAMVETLDHNIGRLLNTIREMGIEQNTIIVFSSDNGGVHWPSKQVMPGIPVTSNYPLRGGKATIYEGGTRVPCIVYWPGVTKPGSVSHEIISSVDWFPTILQMTGVKPLTGQKFDGISITPAFKGKAIKRNAIYCHFPQGDGIFTVGHQPSTYVRSGDWKLIRFYCDNPDQSDRYELFNVKKDIGEKVNLLNKNHRKAGELKKLIDDFLTETTAVVPVPNIHYKKL